MKEVFCDTCYFVALIDHTDGLRATAVSATNSLGKVHYVTTQDVLIELFNYFSGHGPYFRRTVVAFVQILRSRSDMYIVSQNEVMFSKAVQLYSDRDDKGYSLTDCISMCAIRSRGISVVLTNDQHFGQEGFEVLMGKGIESL